MHDEAHEETFKNVKLKNHSKECQMEVVIWIQSLK